MRRGCLASLRFTALAGALLWLSWCGVRAVGRSWFEAARENAAGVAQLKKGQADLAAASFERSAAYRCRASVPLTNLGLARLAQRDAPEAHAAFERALREDPGEATAQFGDGAALYDWGSSLSDFPDPGPAGPETEQAEACARAETLRKAITYWEHALNRFQAASAGDSRLAARARDNAAFLKTRLEALRAREAHYRKICESSCANRASGQGGGSAPQGGRGQAGSPGGAAEPPPGQAATSGGAMKDDQPLTAQERQQVGESLRKQQSQRREKDHYHRQSAPQQWRPENKGQGGPEVLW